MVSVVKNCFLQCVSNPCKKISLLHNVKTFVGRGEATAITDTMLSREQIAVTANYDTQKVVVETVGRNFCGCNGYILRKGQKYDLKHGDCIELLIGAYKYEVLFDFPKDNSNVEVSEPATKKLKTNFPVFDEAKNIKDDSNTSKSDDEGGVFWENIENGILLVCTYRNVKAQSKIAAFDLDGTLIQTKSGARFPKNSDDWKFNFPTKLKPKLKSLHSDGYKIVIFTNQGGIKLDSEKRKEFKLKVESILNSLDVPVQLFAATTNSIYRKPAFGMWKTLCNEKNDGIKIDIEHSIYVGDAAGRNKNWAVKKNKDHSLADRLFALNIGFQFYTPEEYFLGAPSVPHISPKFDPRNLSVLTVDPPFNNDCEVIIMVGSPGSGKTFYVTKHLLKKGYVHINRDILGSWEACVKLLEKTLIGHQSVVIDNTNGDKASRKRFIDVAKKLQFACRCFVMSTSPEHCKHNNKFRELTDTTHKPVGEIVLNMYRKNFQEPTLNEGFDEIIVIDFVPDFNDECNEKLYKMFLLES